MLAVLVLACLVHASLAQSYAERSVVPADTFHPSTAYDEEEDYRFPDYLDEDGYNVYKWNVEDFPHPKNQSRFCNRLKPSNVCDPDGVLEREHADFLDAAIRKLYRETACICSDGCGTGEGGIVAGIALLKHIFQPYNLHHVKTIRSFTEKLRRLWSLGRCDNDLLIVVVTVDRMYYIDVGKATSHYLSVREATEIFVRHKAWFSAGNFFEGLRDILEGYHQQILSKETPEEPELNMSLLTGAVIGGIAILGLLLLIGLLVYRAYKRRKNKNEGDDSTDSKTPNESVSSSWSKKDIKVLFGSEKFKNPPPSKSLSRYQPCKQTDDLQMTTPNGDDEVLDFTLATPDDVSFPNETKLTSVSSDSEALEKDLTSAAENIVKTFPSARSYSSVLMTDM